MSCDLIYGVTEGAGQSGQVYRYITSATFTRVSPDQWQRLGAAFRAFEGFGNTIRYVAGSAPQYIYQSGPDKASFVITYSGGVVEIVRQVPPGTSLALSEVPYQFAHAVHRLMNTVTGFNFDVVKDLARKATATAGGWTTEKYVANVWKYAQAAWRSPALGQVAQAVGSSALRMFVIVIPAPVMEQMLKTPGTMPSMYGNGA